MKEGKFNFIPTSQYSENRDTGMTARVSFGTNRINFSLKNVGCRELIGRYAKIYVDEAKRAISWKLFDEGDGLASLAKHHKIQSSYDNGKLMTVFISDAKMKLPFISKGYTGKESFKNLEINIYEPKGLLEGKYYYVIIPHK